jgi:hypothetical protein
MPIYSQHSNPLTTNGLVMPAAFEIHAYEVVHGLVARHFGKDTRYDHFAGAWNAIAYRFLGAYDSAEAFGDAVKTHGSTPRPPQRYLQERLLFEFFSSVFSVFESSFFAFYAFGSFIAANDFSLIPNEQHKVTPSATNGVYIRAFPGEPILDSFKGVLDDPGYRALRDIRNIVTHRAAPGRRIYLNSGPGDVPATKWKLNDRPFDELLVLDARSELTRLTHVLLTAFAAFSEGTLR